MLKTIIAWLKGEAASVDALIASSTSLITKLEAAAVAHTVAKAKHIETAAKAEVLAVKAGVEAERATIISTKLKDLFS